MTTETPRMDAAELLAIGIGDGRPLYAAGVALEKALYEREGQLREYAQHKDDCLRNSAVYEAVLGKGLVKITDCSCGLDALLARLKEKP